jgi:ankyrin repeat protein
MDIDICAYI